MLFVIKKENGTYKHVKIWEGALTGGGIGFFSGVIGIGGGIILSPIIILMRWGSLKEAAAVSALFIWVNSAAAMAGQLSTGVKIDPQAYILVALATIGGFAGGYLGSKKMNPKSLTYLLSFVLIVACFKLFLT